MPQTFWVQDTLLVVSLQVETNQSTGTIPELPRQPVHICTTLSNKHIMRKFSVLLLSMLHTPNGQVLQEETGSGCNLTFTEPRCESWCLELCKTPCSACCGLPFRCPLVLSRPYPFRLHQPGLTWYMLQLLCGMTDDSKAHSQDWHQHMYFSDRVFLHYLMQLS